MIDHISLRVSDLAQSKKFYGAVLGALGYQLFREGDGFVSYKGREGTSVWLRMQEYVTRGAHVAFRAPERAAVERAYEAGLTAGGKDNGKPGTRPHRGEQYIAFIVDPDGTNIEILYNPDGK
ncbi:MAG: VOC family protein [Candidatus Liptonbacteria bacterium]|nr:VOC family protein [Candidatus Liptonbacteria bacterium]